MNDIMSGDRMEIWAVFEDLFVYVYKICANVIFSAKFKFDFGNVNVLLIKRLF